MVENTNKVKKTNKITHSTTTTTIILSNITGHVAGYKLNIWTVKRLHAVALRNKPSSATVHPVFEDTQQATCQGVTSETEQFSMDEANMFLWHFRK